MTASAEDSFKIKMRRLEGKYESLTLRLLFSFFKMGYTGCEIPSWVKKGSGAHKIYLVGVSAKSKTLKTKIK